MLMMTTMMMMMMCDVFFFFSSGGGLQDCHTGLSVVVLGTGRVVVHGVGTGVVVVAVGARRQHQTVASPFAVKDAQIGATTETFLPRISVIPHLLRQFPGDWESVKHSWHASTATVQETEAGTW